MVSRGGGVGGVGELRRLLAQAAADDDARSSALAAICERSVFAAVVAGTGALRTLTNADGQKAMPLFSAKDTLEAAAKQFKWSSKVGVPESRELSAREAMQRALEQGVEYVVFDVGAKHCVEFARDEVALMLAVKQARQRPAVESPAQRSAVAPARPAQNAAPARAVVDEVAAARRTGAARDERRANTTPAQMPAARSRNSTPAGAERKRAEVPAQPFRERASLPPAPVPAAAAPAAAHKATATAASPSAVEQPAAERRRAVTPDARPAARMPVPAASPTLAAFALDPGAIVRASMASPPAPSGAPALPEIGTAPGLARAVAGLPTIEADHARTRPTTLAAIEPAPNASHALPALELPSVETASFAAAAPERGTEPHGHSLPPSIASGAANATALESFAPRAARVKPTGKGGQPPPSLTVPVEPEPELDGLTGLGFAQPDALPDIQPRAQPQAHVQPQADPQPIPAAPPAEPVRDAAHATVHEVPVPQAAADKVSLKQTALKGMDEIAGRGLKTAAKALASMLGGDSDKRAASVSREDDQHADEQPAASEAEASSEEEEEEERALQPLQLGLSEAVLNAIGDALHAYPEVEWACEVSDGSEVPVVGVRVSLSFMTRVGEIERAVLEAAGTRHVEVRVLMLHEPARMREARAHGNTFFPRRKRPARK